MANQDYPEIVALNDALAEHVLRISVAPAEERLQHVFYKRITLTLRPNRVQLSIPVEDDCDDADDDNPALMLHLVLAECETYEDADDFLVWAREGGLNASEGWLLALYRELGEVVPKIRAVLGHDLKPLSSHDFSLNAGAAQALRRLTAS